MHMDTRSICIRSGDGALASVALKDGVPTRLWSSENFSDPLDARLATVVRDGVFWRRESLEDQDIGMSLEVVRPDDERYLLAVAEALRASGYTVFLFDALREKAWRLLLASAIDDGLRAQFLAGLTDISEADVVELITELEAAVDQLTRIEQEGGEAVAKLETKKSAAVAAIVEQVRP